MRFSLSTGFLLSEHNLLYLPSFHCPPLGLIPSKHLLHCSLSLLEELSVVTDYTSQPLLFPETHSNQTSVSIT